MIVYFILELTCVLLSRSQFAGSRYWMMSHERAKFWMDSLRNHRDAATGLDLSHNSATTPSLDIATHDNYTNIHAADNKSVFNQDLTHVTDTKDVFNQDLLPSMFRGGNLVPLTAPRVSSTATDADLEASRKMNRVLDSGTGGPNTQVWQQDVLSRLCGRPAGDDAGFPFTQQNWQDEESNDGDDEDEDEGDQSQDRSQNAANCEQNETTLKDVDKEPLQYVDKESSQYVDREPSQNVDKESSQNGKK
jgi:hypothetical protein